MMNIIKRQLITYILRNREQYHDDDDDDDSDQNNAGE